MANAKRVLLLVTQADWGGVQAFLVRFAIYLRGQGVEVLLAAGGDGRLWSEAKAEGIPCVQLRHLRREISPVQDLLAIAEVRHIIDGFKPDAIHLNSTKMGAIGSIAGRFSKTKPWTVYRIGGWVFLETLPRWNTYAYTKIEQWTARFKDIIVTVHPGDERIAKDLGIVPRHHIVTVPNGLPDDFADRLLSREDARHALGLASDAFIFGTVANAYPPKALPAYVRALDPILDGLKDMRVAIVGGGPGLGELRDIVQSLRNRERILLAGDRPDMARLYRAFDVFVLPSDKEGMPWSLVEAMASGLPCIATDVGACRWMLLEQKGAQDENVPCGHIIPSGDAKALRDAMHDLMLFADKRRKFEENAAYVASTHFRWSRTAQGNLDALNGV